MRLLLAANASYVPPRGGATRSNLAWLERLATHGHECRVVAATLPRDALGRDEQLCDERIAVAAVSGAEALDERGVEVVRRGALLVSSAGEAGRRAELLRDEIRSFRPDLVLVSSEDVGQPLLLEATREAAGRVICLAHTPQFLPFGPESWHPNAAGAELMRRAAAVVVIGRTMGDYVARHLGCEAQLAHPPVHGQGPWADLGRFDRGLVTIVNPCAIKGLPILLELARTLPECRFGALPGWGTTSADREALALLPNLVLLRASREIDDVLRQTRVLLVPSLWFEGFGLVVIEAMLRGIPVVASDAGGLVESKQGTGFLLPVRRIESWLPEYDERGLPRAVVPPQDVSPWREAVRALSADRALYEQEARRSRAAAEGFVRGADPDALERLLEQLAPGASAEPPTAARTPGPRASGSLRILLAQNAPYYPAHGGGDRSNRLLLEALAERGHACLALARLARFGEAEQREYLHELESRQVPVASTADGIVGFRLNGVEARVLAAHTRPRAALTQAIGAFRPDAILVSTDDPAQVLLEAALGAESRPRVVYLARTTLALPFGPDGAFPSETRTGRLRQVDAVVAVSEYVARYVREWGGIEAVHLPISPMEPGPYPALGRFDNALVTLVNPCAVKGISILLALADQLPEVAFGAVPTWGTNEEDRRALAARPNIEMIAPVDQIDELLARTRVLLVPSLWAEARSRIVVEAMLRGVPVLASDVGGIREAKLGVPYLLPVRQISRYRPELDEQMVPRAEVPPQDVRPWLLALGRLIGDRAHYEELSRASRAAALAAVSKLSVGALESALRDSLARPERRSAGMPRTELASGARSAIARLSPEKRALLALRLRRVAAEPQAAPRGRPSRGGGGRWFAALRSDGAPRLFCLPHAGGGASVFRGWQAGMPGVEVVPVQLPGRESRAEEPCFREMEALVMALGAALAPLAAAPYALFGHSMGAGIVFELAHWLRRRGCVLPFVLVVSAARAPQLRSPGVPQPAPTPEQLLAELRARDGTPAALLDDPEARQQLLPALAADTALYRGYQATLAEPLPVPIRAYGGADDEQVGAADLDGWREQTSASFARRSFPGGHFYLRAARGELLRALGRDLRETLPSARS